MQVFSSDATQRLSTLTVLDSNHLLTGHKDGHITLWRITDNNGIYDFCCIRNFIYHSGAAYCLAILNNNSFVSASKDGTYGVWDLESVNYKRILSPVEWQVSPQYLDCTMVGLPTDDLVAIAGFNNGNKPRYGSFDIWDVASGECIHPDVEAFIIQKKWRSTGPVLAFRPLVNIASMLNILSTAALVAGTARMS
uniref:Uncharacterized protein n=1 Tax=Ditylenchus dipsaci TaxID=166011 RepID=A0A915DKC9_9BILA